MLCKAYRVGTHYSNSTDRPRPVKVVLGYVEENQLLLNRRKMLYSVMPDYFFHHSCSRAEWLKYRGLSCSFCRNVRKAGWSSMLRLSGFGPESHASCTSLEPFDLACAWTLDFLKSKACPVSDICAHMCELVSCLLTADNCILVIRRFEVSPT